MKTIVFHPSAAKEFDALSATDRDRVLFALTDYAVTGSGDIKRLQNRLQFRLRIGRFRVIFAEDQFTILALHIGLRDRSTYRRN